MDFIHVRQALYQMSDMPSPVLLSFNCPRNPGFPTHEHKQQRLFCANKCVLLIADTPFHAKSVQWQVADRYCERACRVCRKQVLPVAGGGFRTPVLQHTQRGASVLPAMWLPQKDWGCHIPTGFSEVNGIKQTGGQRAGNEHRNPYLNDDFREGSEQQLRSGI